MVRKVNETEELQKHTLNLFKGDYEEIQNMFPDLGAAVIIRRVVRNYVEGLREKTQVEIPSNQLELNLNV